MARRDSILVSRTLYQVGMVTLFAAIMWVALGIYFAANGKYTTKIDASILAPINPVLDQDTLKSLAGRETIEITQPKPSGSPASVSTNSINEISVPVQIESSASSSKSATISGGGI